MDWIWKHNFIWSNFSQGAIIEAGSVVSQDFLPYAIYAGNKVVKYIFNKEITDKLLKLDFNKIKEEKLKENLYVFYTKCTIDNIDKIIGEIINEFKKKHSKSVFG